MKAITIGSAMVDIITIVEDADIERMTMHNATSSFLLLEQGRKIDAESITIHVGGGAINTAVCLSRLGHQVASLAKLGEDVYGERIIQCLDQENVSREHIVRTQEDGTGVAIMISSHDRNATIFTQRGVNRLLRKEDLKPAMFEDKELVYISSLSDGSSDCFPLIADLAHSAGAFVATNPGIRQLTSRLNPLYDSLEHVDLIALNSVEAAALIPGIYARGLESTGAHLADLPEDCPDLLRTGLTFGGFTISLPVLFDAITSLGPRYFVLTDGRNGAYLSDGRTIFHGTTLDVKPQGTAGAGDAFISTLVGWIAEAQPLEKCLKAAAINSANVVKVIDTQSGLLDKNSLNQQLHELESEITVQKFDILNPDR